MNFSARSNALVVCVAAAILFSQGNNLRGQANDLKCRFTVHQTYILDGVRKEFVAGDIDGDSDTDLIFAVGSELKIFINLGDASFAIETINLTPSFAVPLDLFDIDGDQDLDLLVWRSSTTIAVMENDGSGNFSQAQIVNMNHIEVLVITNVEHGDLDADGDDDVIVAGIDFGPLSNWMAMFENTGPGILQSNNGTLETRSTNGSLSVADFDGDLDLDLLSAGPYGPFDPVTFLYNDGFGGFEETTNVDTCDSPAFAMAADFNGDSTIDVCIAVPPLDVLKVGINDGSGEFVQFTELPLVGASFLNSGDLDSDGDIDLIALSTGEDRITTLLNNGDGTFVDGDLYSLELARTSVLTDLNGDKTPDLAVRFQRRQDDDFIESVAIFVNECGLPGDIDRNGELNLLDVDPFIQRLVTGEYQLEADMNCDSAVNLLDVSLFVEALLGN